MPPRRSTSTKKAEAPVAEGADAAPSQQQEEEVKPSEETGDTTMQSAEDDVKDDASDGEASDDGVNRLEVFTGEDHTLGNALRWVIMKNPVVEFCGYTMPHPSEDKMHLRVQTYDEANVYEVLEKGLEDLMALCDVVEEKFVAAKTQFAADRMSS